MSKAEQARTLLAEGMSVADVARQVGAHYSQVHGIYRKMQAEGTASEATKMSPERRRQARTAVDPVAVKARAAKKAEPEPTESWGTREDDIDAGNCTNCGLPTVRRSVSYGGQSYGTALIHRSVDGDTAKLKLIERCKASDVQPEPVEVDEAEDETWEDGDE